MKKSELIADLERQHKKWMKLYNEAHANYNYVDESLGLYSSKVNECNAALKALRKVTSLE